jgi:hypothetical protein
MKSIVISLLFILTCFSDRVYGQQQNTELKNKLEYIFDQDQLIRIPFDSLINLHGFESNQVQHYIKHVMLKTDSTNIANIKKIINQYGWVGINTVGEKANQALWLIIQHDSLGTQQKYLPLLRQSVAKGESLPMHLGMLEDRIALSKHEKQMYGTQIWTANDGSLYVAPLVNPDEVNNRRKIIGLGSIESYCKQLGFIWNLDEYKLNLPKYVELLTGN